MGFDLGKLDFLGAGLPSFESSALIYVSTNVVSKYVLSLVR